MVTCYGNYRETVTSLNDFGRLLVCTAIHLGTAAGASLLVARTLNLRKEDYEASNDYEVNIMSITLLAGKRTQTFKMAAFLHLGAQQSSDGIGPRFHDHPVIKPQISPHGYIIIVTMLLLLLPLRFFCSSVSLFISISPSLSLSLLRSVLR